jgi:hypothetical protein
MPDENSTENLFICYMNRNLLGGRVIKQVTNGSKTTVMDVICFLCVPLGSRAVELHDTLGSRNACASAEAGFIRQIGDRV